MLGKVLNAVPVTQQVLGKWDSDDLISLGISVWQAHSAMAGWWLWWAALLSPVRITYPQGSRQALISPLGPSTCLLILSQLMCVLPPPRSYH